MSDMTGSRKHHLGCPCGELLVADGQDELVEMAQEHLSKNHPGRTYDRDMILLMAY